MQSFEIIQKYKDTGKNVVFFIVYFVEREKYG